MKKSTWFVLCAVAALLGCSAPAFAGYGDYVLTVYVGSSLMCSEDSPTDITVHLTDSFGTSLADREVQLTFSNQPVASTVNPYGSIDHTTCTTDQNGIARFEGAKPRYAPTPMSWLLSGYTSFTVTITAAYGGASANCFLIVSMAPLLTTVTDDGQYTSQGSQLHASWTSVQGATYQYAIGTSAGATDVVTWTPSSSASVTKTGLSLSDGVTYYFSVKAARSGCWCPAIYSNGITFIDPNVARVDRPLPTANINGPNRCNIRWASSDANVGYGDTFTLLPSGPQWVIDKVVVWAVPDAPLWPSYSLGDHFSAISLYGGPTSGPLGRKSTGALSVGSSAVGTTDGTTITPTAVTYQGGALYETADGRFSGIWRIEFSGLNWSLTGNTGVFGVIGTPRFDRMWFNHATSGISGGDGQFLPFTVSITNPEDATVESALSGGGWFGGDNGSDINVQVYAHAQ